MGYDISSSYEGASILDTSSEAILVLDNNDANVDTELIFAPSNLKTSEIESKSDSYFINPSLLINCKLQPLNPLGSVPLYNTTD